MKLTFDKPPALNHLYGTNNWGGKYLKAEGRIWQTKAMWMIKANKPENYDRPVSLHIDLFTCRHQDNDSILKLLQDTLQHAGVYTDDYWIFELLVRKHKCKKKEERIEIEVLPLDTKAVIGV